MFHLKLYVVNKSPRSQKLAAQIRSLLDELCPSDYRLEIVDVLESPDVAQSDRVLATPTVIRFDPVPVRRIVGDMADRKKVAEGLGLN